MDVADNGPPGGKRQTQAAASRNPAQNDLFAPQHHPALELLSAADPDALTPRQALELIYRLKKQLPGT